MAFHVQLTVWYDSPLYNGPEQFRAVWETKGLETAPYGVDEAEPRCLKRDGGVDLVVVHIVRDVDEDLVGLWTFSGLGETGHRSCSSSDDDSRWTCKREKARSLGRTCQRLRN